ncbi:MAG: DUF2291 family protein [Prevotella sp.]|nr:DUF2291 family protein [Prevotella sp.]
MKKIILCVILAIVALWGAFYTENLTEKQRREQLEQLKPDELVSMLMKDSLATLEQRAITLKQMKEGYQDEAFAKQHGRVLGIGSPTFYIIKDECQHATIADDELHAVAEGIQITIPLKHIFGNTAREASGWFDIDHFQNTTDFNAVSAAMNTYITQQVKNFKADENGEVEFLAGVAIQKSTDLQQITLIPYQVKNDD